MLKDTLKESDKEQLSTKGKLFIIDTLPNLFSIHSDINTTDEFLALVRDWLDIFLIHFELGYYLEDEFLDVLLGQHAGAGGDVTDERHVADRSAVGGGAGVGVEPDLDGAGLGGVTAEVAHLLEAGEMGVNR